MTLNIAEFGRLLKSDDMGSVKQHFSCDFRSDGHMTLNIAQFGKLLK